MISKFHCLGKLHFLFKLLEIGLVFKFGDTNFSQIKKYKIPNFGS